MSYRTLPSGFVKSVLQNGVGRYVCQLQRVTLKFCKSNGDSKGMREFIERDVINFARSYPGIVVYLKPRRHRSPALYAEYLNGEVDNLGCHNFTREDVAKWLDYLRTRSGFPIVRLRKYWHTDNPSIQGVWTPFTHKKTELNINDFPDEELSRVVQLEPTATEQILKIALEEKKFQMK